MRWRLPLPPPTPEKGARAAKRIVEQCGDHANAGSGHMRRCMSEPSHEVLERAIDYVGGLAALFQRENRGCQRVPGAGALPLCESGVAL